MDFRIIKYEITKKTSLNDLSFSFEVIRLGLEPKTYCLEGSCSIQLSYRTSLVVDVLFRKSGAKVDIFFESTKFLQVFYTVKRIYERSSNELLPSTKAFVALNVPMFSGSS